MSKSVSNVITQTLALIGCFIAIMLTIEHFSPKVEIGCALVGGNCGSTIESQYGHVGPIPTSLFGLAMYVGIFGICVVRGRKLAEWKTAETARAAAYSGSIAGTADVDLGSDQDGLDDDSDFEEEAPRGGESEPVRDSVRHLDLAIWGILALAFGISWYLQYVALFILCAFCPWCLGSAITVTLLFIVASRDSLFDGRKITGETLMLVCVVGCILVLMSLMSWQQVSAKIASCRITAAQTPPPPTTMKGGRETVMRSWMPVKGDPNSKYILVEFADYGCPHCLKGAALLDRLLKEYPQRFQIGYRNFPLGHFPNSRAAAIAAAAAGRQNRYWEMHDVIFDNQTQLNEASFDPQAFDSWAKQLHLNPTKFAKDVRDPILADQVSKDHQDGVTNGVTMTPTFYLVPRDASKPLTKITGISSMEDVVANPKDKIWK